MRADIAGHGIAKKITKRAVAVWLVPILLLSAFLTVSIVYREARDRDAAMAASFRNTANQIEAEFLYLNDFAINLAQVSRVRYLTYMRGELDMTRYDGATLKDLNEYLRAVLSTTPILMDIALVFPDIDAVFYDGEYIATVEEYMGFSNHAEDTQWQNARLVDALTGVSQGAVLYPMNIERETIKYETNGMYYVYSILTSATESRGAVLYRINLSHLYKIASGREGTTFLYRYEGAPICLQGMDLSDLNLLDREYVSGENVSTKLGSMRVYCEEILDTGLEICMFVPARYLRVNDGFWWLMAFYIASVFLLSYFLFRREAEKNLKPIDSVFDMIRTEDFDRADMPSDPEFVEVFDRVHDIIRERDRLSRSYVSDAEHRRILYLKELLERPWESTDDIETRLVPLGVQFAGSSFFCICCKGDSELPPCLRDAVAALGGETTVQIVSYSDYSVVIVNSDDTATRDRLCEALPAITERKDWPENAYVGVGCSVNGLSYVEESYNQALSALNERMFTPEVRVFLYDANRQRENTFYFPIRMEMAIINDLKLSQISKAEETVWKVLNYNTNNARISHDALRRLFVKLCYTGKRALRAMSDLDEMDKGTLPSEEEDMRKLAEAESIPEMVDILFRFYGNVCAQYSGLQTQDHPMRIEIEKYLNARYFDPAMSLTMLADALGVSDSHVSRLINRMYGVSFSEYLNTVRIRHAMELLDNGVSITDAMNQTGYTSLATFRRWFKSHTGMTPHEYMQSNQNTEV